MKKKMISLLLVLALVVGICPAAFAASISYTPYSDSVTTREEQEAHERELFRANPDAYQDAGISSSIIVDYGEGENGLLRAVDPGEGAIRIDTGNMYTMGTIYWDSSKKAPLKEMADLTLTLAGTLAPELAAALTVISVVRDALTISGIIGEIDMSRNGEAKVGHSFSYVTKTGEFYSNNRWEIAVYTQQRYYFMHSYVVAVVDGVTRQVAVDKIPAYGYSAYYVENSAHFNNQSFIQDETLKRYKQKKQTGYFGAYDERWF